MTQSGFEDDDLPDENWRAPDTSDLKVDWTVGRDSLDQFIKNYSYEDIVTELIQNEFDAGGDRIELRFSEQGLQVTGNGNTINSNGWRRLSVMYSTGLAKGADGSIENVLPKQGLIGSKNFGLNSLFKFGNKIEVSSGGRYSFKDLRDGALQGYKSDPLTKDRSGVLIRVRFREEQVRDLAPFTLEEESDLLDGLKDHFRYCAVKLIVPGSRPGLKTIEVVSERLDRRIVWTQSAVFRKTRGAKGAIERTVHVQDGTLVELPNKKQVLKEMEFQDELQIPGHIRVPVAFSERGVPRYFRPRKGEVRIGISLLLDLGRPDLEHEGLFHYPLGMRGNSTCTRLGVNAPFDVNVDRKDFSEDTTEWNDWLHEQAANITIDYLVEDWFYRFGSKSFLLLERPLGLEGSNRYSERITELLSERPCWPTRSRTNGRTDFHPIKNIVIPARKEFYGFLTPQWYLDASMDSGRTADAIRALAKNSGARVFGIDSLVRLRCNDQIEGALMTPPSKEWDLRYDDSDTWVDWKDIGFQIQYAKAFEAVRTDLKTHHKTDLKSVPNTLSAAGDLKPAVSLYAVNPAIWAGCPVPLNERLHPDLWGYQVFKDKRTGLSKTYEENDWAVMVGEAVGSGEATLEERESLFRYIISQEGGGTLRDKTIKALRELPVLKDHRDEWTSPAQLLRRRTRGAKELEPVLSFPNRSYVGDVKLLTRLRLRDSIEGVDLINMAEHVSSNPELADAYEESLYRYREEVMKPKDWKPLSQISFLRWSDEHVDDLEAPENLYLRNNDTEVSLGDQAKFVYRKRVPLYRLLGCLEIPKVEDVIHHIWDLRIKGLPLAEPEIVYPALVKALEKESAPTSRYRQSPIIWDGEAYHAPQDVLVSERSPKLLRLAVPHIAGSERLVTAVLKLGAQNRPEDYHWVAGFQWIGSRESEYVSNEQRPMLRDFYHSRGANGLPQELPNDVRCLLGLDRRLYSGQDVEAGRFVINDYPELAEAAKNQSADIGFPDVSALSTTFLGSLNLGRLTDKLSEPRPIIGGVVEPPDWFNSSSTLKRLSRKDIASALFAISTHHALSNNIPRPPTYKAILEALSAINEIALVESLALDYQIDGVSVKVGAESWLDGSRLLLTHFQRDEVDQFLAMALVRILSTSSSQHDALINTISGLLRRRSTESMKNYLRRSHIPWEPESSDLWDESGEDDLGEDPESDDENPQDPLINGIIENVERQKERSGGGGDSSPTPSLPTKPGAGGGGSGPSQPPLPPVEQVTFRKVPVTGSWSPSARNGSSAGGGYSGGGGWTPRTADEQKRDEEIGRQGEKLAFDEERNRVATEGGDVSLVVWTSSSDPGADHDIKSVDSDGNEIWIEVKSTVGTDGSFSWSIAEFQKAVLKKERYILRRVYMAGSKDARYKDFPDPVAMWKNKDLGIDVKDFWAVVEPLNA